MESCACVDETIPGYPPENSSFLMTCSDKFDVDNEEYSG